jgi:hypothetical protein
MKKIKDGDRVYTLVKDKDNNILSSEVITSFYDYFELGILRVHFPEETLGDAYYSLKKNPTAVCVEVYIPKKSLCDIDPENDEMIQRFILNPHKLKLGVKEWMIAIPLRK